MEFHYPYGRDRRLNRLATYDLPDDDNAYLILPHLIVRVSQQMDREQVAAVLAAEMNRRKQKHKGDIAIEMICNRTNRPPVFGSKFAIFREKDTNPFAVANFQMLDEFIALHCAPPDDAITEKAVVTTLHSPHVWHEYCGNFSFAPTQAVDPGNDAAQNPRPTSTPS